MTETGAFAARTLSLSRAAGTRSARDRAMWRLGFLAGLNVAVWGAVGIVIASVALDSGVITDLARPVLEK